MPSPGHVYEYVTGEEKAWAALNKQALCRLCDSAEPTKWEQISQDSSESIRGFTQFFLLSTVSCSRLMSSGFEWFWHVGREGNWHANKHAHTHRQTCSACVGIFFLHLFLNHGVPNRTVSEGSYLLCGPYGSVWTWSCTNPLACPQSKEGKSMSVSFLFLCLQCKRCLSLCWNIFVFVSRSVHLRSCQSSVAVARDWGRLLLLFRLK